MSEYGEELEKGKSVLGVSCQTWLRAGVRTRQPTRKVSSGSQERPRVAGGQCPQERRPWSRGGLEACVPITGRFCSSRCPGFLSPYSPDIWPAAFSLSFGDKVRVFYHYDQDTSSSFEVFIVHSVLPLRSTQGCDVNFKAWRKRLAFGPAWASLPAQCPWANLLTTLATLGICLPSVQGVISAHAMSGGIKQVISQHSAWHLLTASHLSCHHHGLEVIEGSQSLHDSLIQSSHSTHPSGIQSFDCFLFF